jgi:hypothetical protein
MRCPITGTVRSSVCGATSPCGAPATFSSRTVNGSTRASGAGRSQASVGPPRPQTGRTTRLSSSGRTPATQTRSPSIRVTSVTTSRRRRGLSFHA